MFLRVQCGRDECLGYYTNAHHLWIDRDPKCERIISVFVFVSFFVFIFIFELYVCEKYHANHHINKMMMCNKANPLLHTFFKHKQQPIPIIVRHHNPERFNFSLLSCSHCVLILTMQKGDLFTSHELLPFVLFFWYIFQQEFMTTQTKPQCAQSL